MKKKAGIITTALLIGIGGVAVAAYAMQRPTEPVQTDTEQVTVRRSEDNRDKDAPQPSTDTPAPRDDANGDSPVVTPRSESVSSVAGQPQRVVSRRASAPTSGAAPTSAKPAAANTHQASTTPAPATPPSPPVAPPATAPAQPPSVKPPSSQPPATPPAPQPPVAPQVQPPVIVPPVTPPQPQPATDEEKARQLKESLKSQKNDNVAQFTNDNGQIRTVLWTKGITAPQLGRGGDFKRDEHSQGGRYVTYYAPFSDKFLGSGWYDADKKPGYTEDDRNLCFGAVAANQLHWWMNLNKQRIAKFMEKTDYANKLSSSYRNTLRDLRLYPDSFKGTQNSQLFKMFTAYFGNNKDGFQSDPLVDLFINGYRPKPGGGTNDPTWGPDYHADNRGGFFHAVFGRGTLTQRMTTLQYGDFSKQLKNALRDGKSVAIRHTTPGTYNHVITAWGAEYDLDGRLVGVYITDSDDPDDNGVRGMKRYNVNEHSGRAVLGTNLANPAHGPKVDGISTLDLGEEKWDEYLR